MEIGYVIRDARKWEVDPERTTSKFDAGYYGGLREKAWGEAAFVFAHRTASDQSFSSVHPPLFKTGFESAFTSLLLTVSPDQWLELLPTTDILVCVLEGETKILRMGQINAEYEIYR
jgi:hypothetical protein